jgi:hypothetical protein
MKTLLAILTTLTMVIVSGVPARAKNKDAQQKNGGVVDILNRALGGKQNLRGSVVEAKGSILLVRGDDDRPYTVDTATVDSTTTAKAQARTGRDRRRQRHRPDRPTSARNAALRGIAVNLICLEIA